MKKIKINILLIITCFIATNCGSTNDEIPIDKRYWDTNDYANVIRELKYNFLPDKKLPTFDDPETRIIIEKLTDTQNYAVVLDDKELGLNHKNKVAEPFFMRWKDMIYLYQTTDRNDKFVYEKEFITIYKFGLGLQLKYFKLGNDQAKEFADDPNSAEAKKHVTSNTNTLIKNFLTYLDLIDREKILSDQGKQMYAQGISQYFTELIKQHPNASYSTMERKIDLLSKKSSSDDIKLSLSKIKELIESKK
ncbi:hypothetical protein [Aquimarina aquimarini]|uniref:hypothetical protein n=1 Tax=Aquimarina aquimarini TaxID=1191734 RepID=UPI000D54B284|nr:hypothetical protein [Aquimarina aquimarini]